MDEIKRITKDALAETVAETGFNQSTLAKDYYLTLLLYLLKDVKGIYFKGGTALQKIFLDYSRLSEDIDFTITRNVNLVRREIEEIIRQSKIFHKITQDKHVENFLRLIAHYTDPFGEAGTVFIDLNKRAKLLKKPEDHKIKHFYKPIMPEFSIKTLSKEEMIAEKMAATISRNKPRDHFDLYKIISKGHKINLRIVKQKCKTAGVEFNIAKMFNKAQTLKNRWDTDMSQLIVEDVSFLEVIKALAKHFNLKEEKAKKT